MKKFFFKTSVLCFLLVLIQPCFAISKNNKKQQVTTAVREIHADYNQVKGTLCRNYRMCIGAGRVNEALRADWQQQLKLLQTDIGFEYIRMHGLLHDDMGVYQEDKNGTPVFNFQYIDVVYDFLLEQKIRPFVELSFMPEALKSNNKTVFWWRANISPPKDYVKWNKLIKALIEHFIDRYGKDEVRNWYFEVWNEPDIEPFFSGTKSDYFELYAQTAKTIKSIDGALMVGGPASATGKWDEEFLTHCTSNGIPIDFVSTHVYGIKQGFFDQTGCVGTVLDDNKNAIIDRVKLSHDIIKRSSKPNLELHYTEWSSSYTPTDFIHDTYQQASYIIDKIKHASQYLTSMSYWTFTDIFEENGPRTTPFHGGFGLLNYQSIKKPAYYAYEYINKLGNIELNNRDSSSWICKSENGIQALFWNFNPVTPPDSMINQVYYAKELPSKIVEKVHLKIDRIPDGLYSLNIYQTGYRVNDVFTSYLDLGAPSQLTRNQESCIKSINNNKPIQERIIRIKNAVFEYDTNLRDNDVYFINLTKIAE